MNKLILLLFISFHFIFSQSIEAQISPNKEWLYFNQGEKERLQKQYDEAISHYEKAIFHNPKESIFYVGLGLCYIHTQLFADAIVAFEKSLKINPKCERSYAYLTKSYAKIQQNEMLVDVLDRWAYYTEDAGKKMEKKREIIKLLGQQDKYSEALHHANEALGINSQCWETLYLNSKLNNKLGNYLEAKVSAKKALNILGEETVRDTDKIYFELGYALHHLQELRARDEAFAFIVSEKYNLDIEKLYIPYFIHTANAYSEIFDFQLAEESILKALEMDKNNTQASKVYAQLKKKMESASQENIERNRKIINLHYKTLQNAIENAKEGVNVMEVKDFRERLVKMMELQINIGNYEVVIENSATFLKKLRGTFIYCNLQYYSAIANLKLGNTLEAIETLNTILSFNRTPFGIRQKVTFTLGYINQQMGEVANAQEIFRKLLITETTFQKAASFSLDQLKAQKQAKHSTQVVAKTNVN